MLNNLLIFFEVILYSIIVLIIILGLFAKDINILDLIDKKINNPILRVLSRILLLVLFIVATYSFHIIYKALVLLTTTALHTWV